MPRPLTNQQFDLLPKMLALLTPALIRRGVLYHLAPLKSNPKYVEEFQSAHPFRAILAPYRIPDNPQCRQYPFSRVIKMTYPGFNIICRI